MVGLIRAIVTVFSRFTGECHQKRQQFLSDNLIHEWLVCSEAVVVF